MAVQSIDKVIVTKILVIDENPAEFYLPYKFKVEYTCFEHLEHKIEFKVVYVGCTLDDEYNQDLDTVYVRPVTDGCHVFEIECNPPEIELIPENDLTGQTFIFVIAKFRRQEFFRLTYHVNVKYENHDKLMRHIDTREIHFARSVINWDDD